MPLAGPATAAVKKERNDGSGDVLSPEKDAKRMPPPKPPSALAFLAEHPDIATLHKRGRDIE